MAEVDLMDAVVFRDKQGLAPGDCDYCETPKPARYCLGDLYFCPECLIKRVEAGKVCSGASVYRVPQSAEEMLGL